MKILKKKQPKKHLQLVEKQFKIKIDPDCYIKRHENKFYLISKDLEKADLSGLKVISTGLYFGKLEQGIFLPSKEAAQMFNFPV